jgi:hypothetical protein
MLTEYLIYRPGATEPEKCEVDWPEAPKYEPLKALIEPLIGGGLEHVAVLFQGKRADMFVHEYGAGAFGMKPLPVNAAATAIYHAASKAVGHDVTRAPRIYGVAVVFRRRVWF